MMWTRRACLAGAWAATLGACAASKAPGVEHLVDTATGGVLGRSTLTDRVGRCDALLLGELHDNPRHHQARADLLASLPGPVTVVAEHLPRGARLMLPAGAPTEVLLRELERVGFEAAAWGWPLHAPLFAAIARAGHGLHGGNLAREQVRAIAREGLGAVPPELRGPLERAPLSPRARQELEQDLVRGHCGQLGPSRVPAMLWAQRGRDVAMALSMAEALDAVSSAGNRGPVVLVAGNGHVRKDYGVPQVLAVIRPGTRLLSIGFGEDDAPDREATPAVVDVIWSTEPAQRADPCEAFRSGRPVPG